MGVQTRGDRNIVQCEIRPMNCVCACDERVWGMGNYEIMRNYIGISMAQTLPPAWALS